MNTLSLWKNRIDTALLHHLQEELALWQHIPRSEEFFAPLSDYIQSGKRTRALLCVAGYSIATAKGDIGYTPDEDLLNLCSAIELYQASALVHDDIIDEAQTRRGMPAMHCQYEQTHCDVSTNAARFGEKAGILCGDFLLSLADRRVSLCHNNDVSQHFALMTSEVALGQFLDVSADETHRCLDTTFENSMAVLSIKAAHYSVVHPTVLGALLGKADAKLVTTLEEITNPWGLAFQLRDDALGITGDTSVTGKPAGDDIRTGKKTPLLALTLQRCSPQDADFICSTLGCLNASDNDIHKVIDIMMSTQAWDAHEKLITKYQRQGAQALTRLEPGPGREMLEKLGHQLAYRDA